MTPIVWIFGQSNADGSADVQSVTNQAMEDELRNAYPAVQILDKRADDTLDPPNWVDRGPTDLSARPGGNFGIFGCELTLGRSLHKRGLVHNIVKTSIRGSLLNTQWLPTATYPSTGGNLWTQAVAHVQSGETDMDGYVQVGLWIQGEADAGNNAASLAYEDNLNALMDEFFDLWPDAYFVISQLHKDFNGSFNDRIRDAERTIAKERSRVRIVSTDDVGLVGAHWTADANVTLGYRYADVISGLLTKDRTVGLRVGPSLGF